MSEFESSAHGGYHETLQSRLDLFRDAPKLLEFNEVPIGAKVHIRSNSHAGEEESIVFRRLSVQEAGSVKKEWMLLTQQEGKEIEEPVNLFGACANPRGGVMEAGALTLRKYMHFAYAVVHPLQFRHGSEVPGTEFEHYPTPEEKLDPDILRQHLETGWVFYGGDGLLYWNEIDNLRSGQRVTGEVFAVNIEETE